MLKKLIINPLFQNSLRFLFIYGNGYAIKSITENLTGVFYGLPHKDSNDEPEQLFNYLLIVLLSDSYQVKAV